MPGQSGYQFLPELVTKWPNTWVVMTTAIVNLNTAVDCMKIGAADYITKPFDLNNVACAVKQILEKKEKQERVEESRKQSEDKLHDILQQECELREKFIHSVAHEIRTPLTSILCSAELLKDNKESNLVKDSILQNIIQNCQKVNNKLSDVDILENKYEDLTFEYSTVNVEAVINQAIKQVDQDLKLKKQSMKVELPPDFPSIVSNHEVLVRILSSLLLDSITYSPFGSTIILRVNKLDEEIIVEIVDESPHIDAVGTELMFQPCYQREVGGQSSEIGFGIDLALAARLASSIGGEVWFDGEAGCNTYVLALPIPPAPNTLQSVS